MSGEFVAAMGDVLELYAEPDDPRWPRVNFDECSVELHADAQSPVPPAPGRPARIDCEYVRSGSEVAAWQATRDRDRVKIDWCFKAADARKKLDHIYP